MPKSWAQQLETMLTQDEREAEQSSSVYVANAQTRIGSLQGKLKRLLDSYLDQDIDQSVYRAKQAELMSEKKSLEERVGKLTLTSNAWIEPMRQWLKTAVSLKKIAENAELVVIKQAFSEIDGLNLFLKSKKAQPAAAPTTALPPENIWVSLRKTKEKAAQKGDDFRKSFFLVRMRGLEPPRPKAYAPKAYVYTNFTTSA